MSRCLDEPDDMATGTKDGEVSGCAGAFEASDVPALRDAAESALCSRRAQQELAEGRARAAVAFLDRALLQRDAGIPDSRLQGHLIRARAHSAEGDGEACAGDVETALSIVNGGVKPGHVAEQKWATLVR